VSTAPDSDRPATAASGHYAERLRVPLRWWAIATMFWASVLLAFLVALPVAFSFATVGAMAAATAAFFVGYGRSAVVVAEGTFRAGRAEIPLHHLADPEPLDADEARRVAGVGADARAYLLLRPYVRRAVKVRVVDPEDPTPYWMVSTRHPRTLAAELAAAIR
jgi:hypothetical protein